MTDSLAFGFSQLSLAFFTTFGPSAAFAYVILATLLLLGNLAPEQREKLDHYLLIPISLGILGVLASTTHLGKPSNSLFVLTGIGRSPLSNEVFAAVIFVGIVWLRWLLGYSKHPLSRVKRILLVAGALAALGQIWFTANAYSIRTIIAWSLPFTQVNQISAAVFGGCLLAKITLWASRTQVKHAASTAIAALACLAFAALATSEIAQCMTLVDTHSTLSPKNHQVGTYIPIICTSMCACVASLACLIADTRTKARFNAVRRTAIPVLGFMGIFIARFGFYFIYLTAGF